jgi:uncharacterized protein YecE (DUF72 family)
MKKTMTPRDGHVRVGIGGWTYAPWRSNFYPDGLQQRLELEFASRQLTTIEINGTWYGAQKPPTYAKWRNETPDGFVFSLKAPRYATQGKTLAGAGKTIQGFIFGGLSELGDRLGPISWQLAPNRQFVRDDLAAFLDLLPRELDGRPLRHVLEVRHESFKCPGYLALAREHRVPTVFTDSSDYPSFADVTGDFVYARLMRSKSSIKTGYSAAALDTIAAHARAWTKGAAPADLPYVGPQSKAKPAQREVFIYFISAAKERNPAAALSLLKRLEK